VTMGLTGAAGLCGFTYIPCVSGLLCVAAALSARQRPDACRGAVYTEGDTLVVEPDQAAAGQGKHRTRSFRLSDVVQGFWESPDCVHLVTRGGETVLVRASRFDGDRLLQAAGVGPAERVLRVPLASLAARISSGPALAGVALGMLFLTAVPLVSILAKAVRTVLTSHGRSGLGDLQAAGIILGVMTLLGGGLVLLLRRREAVLGTDGVLFHGALRRRFIPLGALRGAEPHPRGVALQREGARPFLLPTGRVFTPESALYRDVLLERLHEALAARGGEALARVDLERLERRGRPLAVWRDELGKLLHETGDYRRRGLSAAELGAVIEDTSASAERRIAAAVALGSAHREEARQRVRIATQATVDDDLRQALERAAEGEIEAALLEQEEKRRGGR